MKILALETSSVAADVALLEATPTGIHTAAQRQLPGRPRTAQTLAPAMAELLRQQGWQPTNVELVAVAVGPGSFTGLRLGITTAKVFAYATDIPVQGVNTLSAIASNAGELVNTFPSINRVCTLMDAQRSQVFAASYNADALRHDNTLERIDKTSIADDDVWLASRKSGDLLIGPGLNKFREHLGELSAQEQVHIAPEHLWQPTAVAIGEIAWREFSVGQSATEVWSLVPQYYRQSAAEEKRAQQGT